MDPDFWERPARRHELSVCLLGGPIRRAVTCTREVVRGADRVFPITFVEAVRETGP